MLKEFNECSLFKYQSIIIKNNNNIFYLITQMTQMKPQAPWATESPITH